MGHWYTSKGEPMHWIEGANGKQRDTTLRDARKLNLRPSVTEILNTIDKPALTRWKLNQVTKAAYDNPPTETDESQGNYHKFLMDTAFKDSTDARDRGSLIHDCLEAIAAGLPKTFPDDIQAIGNNAWGSIVEYCETSRFTAEQTVSGNGYGGMIDLHNDEFVIDYKSKDIDDPNKKMAWDEQAMQLAAYKRALRAVRIPRRCINVFIDRTQPGLVVIHEWEPEEIELAWQKFELLVKYWQLSKGYFPE